MRLNLKALRSRGWLVDVSDDEIVIYGREPLPFVGDWVDSLNELGLTPGEVDGIVGDAATAVEERLILRAAR